MKRRWIAAIAAAVGIGVAAGAMAQQKPDQLIKQRKSAMALVGWYFGPLGAMVKGTTPFDQAVATRNAEWVSILAQMPMEGFRPGTDKGDTRAKPEVFTDLDGKFKSGMEAFQREAVKLAQAAKSGDQSAFKQQFGETAKTCRSCHDGYRKD